MRTVSLLALLTLSFCRSPERAGPSSTMPAGISTVFLIVMENSDWTRIRASASAPYINGTLLPQASSATQYFNPPGLHPSLPNYLWMEAGASLGVSDDDPPAAHHFATPHLVSLLTKAGIAWKAYQEDIDGTTCPTATRGLYAPKHNPFVYFDDVLGDPPFCVAHVRPYAELREDLRRGSVARYNFITPNLCNDMHDSSGCATPDRIANGDAWLSREVPRILSSAAFAASGALFITWDEGDRGDGPIGLIVLSPLAKGGGYAGSVPYTHSSLLRSLQEVFAVQPFLGDAARSNALGDLFKK